tara:strand:+ start:626 stop:2104 length:1479 start_codon:yes stop_codon:yes gene_type:complete
MENIINLNKKNNKNLILLINIIFCFFPISFILGNFFININIILFCILGIYILRSKILTNKFNFTIKIIFLLFCVILFSTSLSFITSLYFEGYEYKHLSRLIKSVLFFRYFLLLLIIYFLNDYDVINYKYFFLVGTCSTLIISLDVIYQYFFGFNIIGLKSHIHHNSSFFGNEFIAGGYIQRFSLFSIFFLYFILNDKKYLKFILTTLAVVIIGIGILFSFNRMPLISYLFGLLIVFFFSNKLKIIVPAALVCFVIFFNFALSSDPMLKKIYHSFHGSVASLFFKVDTIEVEREPDKKEEQQICSDPTFQEQERLDCILLNQKKFSKFKIGKLSFLNEKTLHARLFLSSIDTWSKNKIFGNGIKSFRIDCWEVLQGSEYNLLEEVDKFKKNRMCSNHPHNYYFEILTETGIVGLLVTLALAMLFIFFIVKNFKLFKGNNIENLIFLAATISLILEVFPIKTTGSIFSTNNAAYIILISSIILSYRKKLNTNHL